MIVENDKIKKAMKLIEKYGLLTDPYFIGYEENRYGWIVNSKFVEGNIIGIGDISHLAYEESVMFAEGVNFGRYDKGVIACWGWEPVPIYYYEERLKDLKKQFDVAMLEYKKYLIDEKMERMGEDFV